MTIFILYFLFTVALSWILHISVRMCTNDAKTIEPLESFNVTSSSSLANFFGPLQSGVGVRAFYLKQKFGIALKKYGLISLYYYAIYAVLSAVFLLFGSPIYRLPLLAAMLLIGGASIIYIRAFGNKDKQTMSFHVAPRLLILLAVAVLVQLVIISAIYFTELRAVGAEPSLAQTLSYSGAANFSLFVAFTPGAIGIREAFLVFSQSIHQIPSNTIVSANLVDRAVYLTFLLAVFLWLTFTHAKKRLALNQGKSSMGNDNE